MNTAIDLINVLSYLIGVENLQINDAQIKQLEEHLRKQDTQYERIIELLEKEGFDGTGNRRKETDGKVV